MTDAGTPSPRLYCNGCGRETVHVELKTVICSRREGTGEYTAVMREEWRIHQCAGCESSKAICQTFTSELEVKSEVCYPPNRRRSSPAWTRNLPDDCQTLVREIYDALDIGCRILSTMGARTLIDLMLTEMLGDMDGFSHKLKTAVANGTISAAQNDAITIAVDAGHAALHRGFVPTLEQLEDVLEIVEHTLKDRYVMQKASDRLKIAVPKREKGG